MSDDYRARMMECYVPGHTHDGLVRYLVQGIRPGSFLCAILENNLREAVQHADMQNRRAIPHFVDFLTQHAPDEAWGSPAKVAAWLVAQRARAEADR